MLRVLLCCVSVWVAVTAAAAGSLLEGAERDELHWVEEDDAVMNAAIARARATLPGFFEKATHPRIHQRQFSLKVRVLLGDGRSEYLWVRQFANKDDDFIGIVSNIPRMVPGLKEDGILVFAREDISDWMYLEGGRMIGNFTMCAMLTSSPSERGVFEAKYGLDCTDGGAEK